MNSFLPERADTGRDGKGAHREPDLRLARREHPDLDQLKRQAKELLAAFLAGEPDAVAEVQAHYREPTPRPSRCTTRNS